MKERSLILVKPDGVRRGLVGEIISRFEKKGLSVIALKMLNFDDKLADRHYDIHVKKDFYPPLKKFITSGRCVAMVIEGNDAIALCRALMGATSPLNALPGTIRGDFACSTTENLVHGSDAPERAQYEIGLFFKENEIFNS